MKIINAFFVLAIAGLGIFSNSNKVEAADDGLIIYAAEMGIGKFHRYDNKVHKYENNNVWRHFILPEGDNLKSPLVRTNDDSSVTIFFSSLEELLQSVEKVSNERKTKVSVLNLNAHGMPGAMWFPVDESARKSSACADWVSAAEGDDKANYDQYYSPIPKAEIIQIRLFSKLPSMGFMAPCTTGASGWSKVLKRNPGVKAAFASDAQLHLFSCIVGLGWAGKRFTANLAEALFTGDGAKVEAAMNFGLGDWSMPEGMGFWDYLNDEQLKRDNAKYPINRSDREMMQKGQIRIAQKNKNDWNVGIVENLDFMLAEKDNLDVNTRAIFDIPEEVASQAEYEAAKANGMNLRIPGTKAYVKVKIH